MTHLWTTFYQDAKRQRRDELHLSLILNAQFFDVVHVVCEGRAANCSEKNIEPIVVTERPTVGSVLTLAQHALPDDLVVVGNCDIVVPANAIEQMKMLQPRECFALARWEPSTGLFDVNYSNDIWAFRGPPPLLDAPYWWGVPGVDNRLCHELKQAGYNIANPSKSIKTYHLHTSQQRTETNRRPFRVPPPYLFIEPHELGETPVESAREPRIQELVK